MHSKKGFEFAINTLMVMILGLMVLSVGFVIMRNVINSGYELSDNVDEQLKESLRTSQFANGRRVAILSPHAIVNHGEGKEFLLGFVNKLDLPGDFSMVVEFSEKSPVLSDTPLSTAQKNAMMANDVVYLREVVRLENNEEHFAWIYIELPKDFPSGQYLFDVFVCTGQPTCNLGLQPNPRLYAGQKQRIFFTVE